MIVMHHVKVIHKQPFQEDGPEGCSGLVTVVLVGSLGADMSKFTVFCALVRLPVTTSRTTLTFLKYMSDCVAENVQKT